MFDTLLLLLCHSWFFSFLPRPLRTPLPPAIESYWFYLQIPHHELPGLKLHPVLLFTSFSVPVRWSISSSSGPQSRRLRIQSSFPTRDLHTSCSLCQKSTHPCPSACELSAILMSHLSSRFLRELLSGLYWPLWFSVNAPILFLSPSVII